MKSNKSHKISIIIVGFLLISGILVLIYTGRSKDENQKSEISQDSEEASVELPWENGGKRPSEYTKEEYEALPEDQKVAFEQAFEDSSDFTYWAEIVYDNEYPPSYGVTVNGPDKSENDNEEKTEGKDESEQNTNVEEEEELIIPWENGGKQPSEYTWIEFEALTGPQQIVFQNSFGSFDKFEEWFQKVNPDQEEVIELPWENGGKQPSEYTWIEFEKLTASQQMAFQNSFDSTEKFNEWFQKVNPDQEEVVVLPWENGGKQPSEYNWKEYEKLTAAQQMAFQDSFGSIDAFDEWLQKEQPDGSKDIVLPWEDGGKQPTNYTWKEFEALTGAQQMAFQMSFKTTEAFDAWLQANQPSDSEEVVLPWENGGKQPSEYTWKEFEALTGAQQIAFQASFKTIETFDAWLWDNQPSDLEPIDVPWKNGGKQPSEYTWEEFEALTGPQQIEFQKSFASLEKFDEWLIDNQPQ